MTRNLPETRRLVGVVEQLRRRCPWDRKQTHRSLVPYLIEEAYETIDAIQSGKGDALREELGDVLLQVVLHAEIAKQKGRFSFEDVARTIADKMVRRHPHVFGREKAGNTAFHQRRWTALKAKERPKKGPLDGIPRAMPGVQLAQRYGEIAASVGFDWDGAPQVMTKVREELRELDREIRRKNRRAAEMELGDLLFTLANLARHLGIDADRAARKSAAKFRDRFRRLEATQRRRGKSLDQSTMRELNTAWEALK